MKCTIVLHKGTENIPVSMNFRASPLIGDVFHVGVTDNESFSGEYQIVGNRYHVMNVKSKELLLLHAAKLEQAPPAQKPEEELPVTPKIEIVER